MTGNVIDLGEVRIEKRWQRGKRWSCSHRRLVLDPENQSAVCEDCGVVMGAWKVVERLMATWEKAQAIFRAREQRIKEAEKHQLIRRASKKVDEVWRSRKYVPKCPHCKVPIYPEDGLGLSSVWRDSQEEKSRRDLQLRREQKRENGSRK